MNKTGKTFLLLVTFLFFLAGFHFSRATAENTQPQTSPGNYNGKMTVDGRERTYNFHLPPAYNGQKKMPLVVVLHGAGSNADRIAEVTGMDAKADKEGFIVAYPEGISRVQKRLGTWNSGNCCGPAMDEKVDDVKFIGQVIEELKNGLQIDPRRVYVTGMSNGGMMSYRLACELSDQIAAIAPVAGAMNVELCNPNRPVSVMIVHGTADRAVRYKGGSPNRLFEQSRPRVDKSVAEAAKFWIQHNQCAKRPLHRVSGNVVRDYFSNYVTGAEVAILTVKGGGHAWPGGNRGCPMCDTPSRDLNATDEIWQFFSRHSR